MSALSQKRTCAAQKVMSALPSKADVCGAIWDVCFVPIADILFFSSGFLVLRSNADAVAAPPVASPAAPQPLGFGWLADIP